MAEHIISMVVEHQVGVLSRVTSILKRKMLNILSLSIISETNSHTRRMTIVVEGDGKDADLACKFLANNVDILAIDLYAKEEVIQRELTVVQAKPNYCTEQHLNALSTNFNLRVLRSSASEVIIEFIGSEKEVDLFLEGAASLSPTRISRTGIVAVSN